MRNFFLFTFSLFLFAFGQPSFTTLISVLAFLFGFAFFGLLLLDRCKKERFFLGFLWFSLVQLIQYSWFLSHPYPAIFFPYLFLSLGIGLQMGFFALFMKRKTIDHMLGPLALAGIWTLLEWSRLYIFCGITWNPIGLAACTLQATRQASAIWGIYGQSFIMMALNLYFLRFLEKPKPHRLLPYASILLMLFIFAALKQSFLKKQEPNEKKTLRSYLLQPAFTVNVDQNFRSKEELIAFLLNKWKTILLKLHEAKDGAPELIVLPEIVVPFGTYRPIYSLDDATKLFTQIFGKEIESSFPPHFRWVSQNDGEEKRTFVANGFFAQTLANHLRSVVVVGLEDEGDVPDPYVQRTAAVSFYPHEDISQKERPKKELHYAKRVLVPFGEYIPFELLKPLANRYGIQDSFQKGQEAKTIPIKSLQGGLSICYEETFGHLMRENKKLGCDFLINLTNDNWYPRSRLTRQHFELARVRCCELGVPLLRATTTGVTAACDHRGEVIASLPDDLQQYPLSPKLLVVDLPIETVKTPYTFWGDTFSVLGSLFFILIAWKFHVL